MKSFWQDIGPVVAAVKPALESLFIFVLLVVIQFVYSSIETGQPISATGLSMAVIGAVADYITSKGRHEDAKAQALQLVPAPAPDATQEKGVK